EILINLPLLLVHTVSNQPSALNDEHNNNYRNVLSPPFSWNSQQPTLQTVPGWEQPTLLYRLFQVGNSQLYRLFQIGNRQQPTLQTVPGWEQTTANSTDCSRLGTARSPDLNPIEHIWDIMSRSIHQRHVAPQTVQELADALVQVWEEIPQETIRHLIRSMPRRCKEVIQARG
uniref:Tc1-like transposase DDE domain-containing protein n=1 Tax=Oncorhynchus tshawytscha TaxID=74940 RepID=A0AAZ3SMG2_ONCTS